MTTDTCLREYLEAQQLSSAAVNAMFKHFDHRREQGISSNHLNMKLPR